MVLFTGTESGLQQASQAFTAASSSLTERTIGIGNVYFPLFAGSLDFAEAIIFDSALDAGALEAVYWRSVDRLATRGVAVVAPALATTSVALPSTTPAQLAVTPEAGAVAHWLFGVDNPSFQALDNGPSLTAQGTHTNHAGYTSAPAAKLQGLRSTIPEGTAYTWCVVFSKPTTVNNVLVGNIGIDVTDRGAGLYAATNTVTSTPKSTGLANYQMGAVQVGSFYFVALSSDAASKTVVTFMVEDTNGVVSTSDVYTNAYI
eukprot:2089123-Rhodomonas_salina.1